VSKTKLKKHGEDGHMDVDVLAIQDRLERSLGRKSALRKGFGQTSSTVIEEMLTFSRGGRGYGRKYCRCPDV
jgi:hypothetical protein